MALRKAERSIKVYPMPALTGGLSTNPSQDNECEVFENATLVRDNWLRTRPGTYLAHAEGGLNHNPITGIANYGLGDGDLYVIVTKSDATLHYHKMQAGWKPGDTVSFGTVSMPYGGLDEVRFEAVGIKI
jgi:hypothetical protein